MSNTTNTTTDAAVQRPWAVGDRVEGGEPGTEDHDTGRVIEVDGTRVHVAWDTLVTAWRGVSTVCRGPGGFLEAYTDARGNPDRLPPWWHAKRAAFIARMHGQAVLRGASRRGTRRGNSRGGRCR